MADVEGRLDAAATAGALDPRLEAYNAFVLKHTWYNLALNVADGAIFAIGMALVPVETVLPGFIKDCADRVPGIERLRKHPRGRSAVHHLGRAS